MSTTVTDDGATSPPGDRPRTGASGPGAWLARHRWYVIGVWVAVAVALTILTNVIPHQARNVFNVPNSGSEDALDVLEQSFPDLANPIVTVVYASTDGNTLLEGNNAQLIGQAVTNLSEVEDAANVTDPTSILFRRTDVSSDGSIAFSTMTFSEPFDKLALDVFDQMEDAVEPITEAGLQVEFSGALIDVDDPPRGALSQYADEISIVVAIIIVLLAFGSPIVALLPIVTALVALSVSLSVLGLLETAFNVGTVNQVLGTMLALGVGVDYSLLITNRYRQLRAEGHDIESAIALAWSSAGRSVVFAGTTICVTSLALAVVGVPFISLLGLTAAMFVAITVTSAMTLLPALLSVSGKHIDWKSLPWGGTHETPKDGLWAKWAHLNARHRVTFVVVPIAVLVVVAIPALSADLGLIDDGALPEDTTQRQAYDLLTEGFGEGENAPLLVVAQLPGGGEGASGLESLFTTLRNTDGVSTVSPPNIADDGAVFRVIPDGGADSPETADLVRNLRSTVLPEAVAGTGISADEVFVGGETATFIDFTDRVSARLGLYILIGLGIAFLALTMAFKSLVVPLKAIILAFLSFFTAYGVIVAMTQWGWLRDVIALDTTVPIESFTPIMLFAILIGLTLDYEVFLVSRIREEFVRSGDPDVGVTEGLRTTGKVVMSAGLIMGCVFLVFVTNPSPIVKQVALGLGIGVLADSLIVRMMVVPGLLRLLGRAAWWYPKPLERITPDIQVGESAS